MILNPHYTDPLVGSAAGMNSFASKYQNFYASLVMGGGKLDKAVGDQLANKVLEVVSGANDATLAPAAQTMVAWQLYMADQGLWDGDASKVQELSNAYMKSVIQYGVACCHHTCKNLAFNLKVIQMSSLTPAEKQKFSEILAQATNTDPLYKMDSSGESSGKSGDAKGNNNANTLTNDTSQQQSESSSSGGSTAAGVDPSTPGNAKSASESQSSQDASSTGGTSKAYELSEKSASKSTSSSAESNMPIFVIIAIIVLIAIFLVGYLRNNNDEYDDY